MIRGEQPGQGPPHDGGQPETEGAQVRAMMGEWRRAWRPSLVALIGGSISYSLYSAVSSLFVEPLQAAFGWSRGDISFAYAFGVVTAFSAPLIGQFVDRYGVRPVLSLGLVLTALCYILLAAMNGSLFLYYAIFFALSLVGMATTGVTFTRIISGAFDRTRGSALAICRSGLALTGAAMPFVLYPIIKAYGVAGGFLTLAALLLFIALPLVRMWIRREHARPLIDGGSRPGAGDRWQVLMRQPKIAILTLAAVLNYAPVVSLLTQLKPLATSKGIDGALAVAAVSTVGLAAVGGALLSGILVDRFWAPAVAFILNIIPAIGCLLLLQADVTPFIFFSAMLMIGLGQGAEIDIVAYMIGRYFGLRNYATIYGVTTLGISLGITIGGSMIGRAYDVFGDYDVPLGVASACFALAAFCYLAMGRYPLKQSACGALGFD